MVTTNSAPTHNPTSPRFVKTNIPNLVKLEPMGTYYGRCKVHGKLVRQSLETKDFKVAKSKLLQWLMDTRGRVNAFEGHMGSLTEEYTRRLKLAVDNREIRERTMNTKIESLTQIQKVWEERFSTGTINPLNYKAGGDQTKRPSAKYPALQSPEPNFPMLCLPIPM